MSDITYIVVIMMMDQFRRDVEAFLTRTGMAPSRFGRDLLNDPGFVYRLRNGSECRPSTIDRVRAEMVTADAPICSEDAPA